MGRKPKLTDHQRRVRSAARQLREPVREIARSLQHRTARFRDWQTDEEDDLARPTQPFHHIMCLPASVFCVDVGLIE
jgi:hypothetical protein